MSLYYAILNRGVFVRIRETQEDLVRLANQVSNILNTPAIPVKGGVDVAAHSGKVEIIVGSPLTQP
jgi:hypothetical protein